MMDPSRAARCATADRACRRARFRVCDAEFMVLVTLLVGVRAGSGGIDDTAIRSSR